MATHNPENERIKRRYFAYQKEAKRHSEPTVDAVAKALARFEADIPKGLIYRVGGDMPLLTIPHQPGAVTLSVLR